MTERLASTVYDELRTRNRQQSAVAELGQTAIRSSDLDLLLDQAVALSADTLETEASGVMSLLPNGEDLLLRAGVGWNKGLVGHHLAPTSPGSSAGFVMRAGDPVIIPDVRKETRFTPPAILLDHGIVSVLGVIIRGREHPWGMLAVHSKRARVFGLDDIGFLQSVANVLALAIERHELETKQRREKETLEALFENIPVMLALRDGEGRLLRVNREWEQTLGWTIEEARRTDLMSHAYPDPQPRQEALDLMASAHRRWVDFRPRTRDGRQIDVSWMRFDLSDGTRIGFGLDVTERKRVESERNHLLESETRARAEAEAALERLHAIQTITDAALAYLSLDDLLRELLRRLRTTLQVDLASVRLLDESGQRLYARAIDGVPFERVVDVVLPVEAVNLSSPVMANDVRPPGPDSPDWYVKSWNAIGLTIRNGMSTPLVVEGKPIGIVGVATTREVPFTADDLYILQVVADRAAPAIERGRLMETVRAGEGRLKTLSRQLLTAHEKERRRVAVELHDQLGQSLTAVKINLQSLERSAADAEPLAATIECIDQLMQRVRDIALDLRPSVLDDLGLSAALRWYVDRFARDTRLQAHLAIDALPRLDPDLETACFRVAQEALTNVARHARASHVWLDLRLLSQELELVIRDDGVGFDLASARRRAVAGGSMGLLGMQERVSLTGGDYVLVTRPSAGTEVRARFPVGPRPGGPV